MRLSLFQNESKGEMPVAIIQNGTTPEEKSRIGTIDTIQETVAVNKLSSPHNCYWRSRRGQ
jgi:uroporphyrin-III C-methyltransferase